MYHVTTYSRCTRSAVGGGGGVKSHILARDVTWLLDKGEEGGSLAKRRARPQVWLGVMAVLDRGG